MLFPGRMKMVPLLLTNYFQGRALLGMNEGEKEGNGRERRREGNEEGVWREAGRGGPAEVRSLRPTGAEAAARVQLWADAGAGPRAERAGDGLAEMAMRFGCCVSTVAIIRRILCLFRLRAVR